MASRRIPSRISSLAGLVLGLSFAVLAAVDAGAQAPSEPWRTLEIPGFRFHTPSQSEPWTRDVVSRMAQIQAMVAEEVGFELSRAEIVDVIVIDPVARANGTAWPILSKPRLVLYTTPPPSHGALGHFHHWPEILAIHEVAHLAHLLRPSRHPVWSRFESLIPVGPLPRKAPNWVIEGYATLIEGRLTGWGRPNGDMRAALLRRWAQTGQLPSYGALSGTSGRWLGRAFPYLVGSAFLEWLQEREGEDSLRDLWARLSARRERSFDAAFRGVFGDSPARLYGRFTAELTFRAMRVEAERSDGLVPGELWQDLSWHTGAPAVSPDGNQLAVVLRRRAAPSRLVIWSTADDPEPLRRLQEKQEEMLRLDPQDVAPEIRRPLPRDPLFELPTRHGAEPYKPRFMPDGESVLFLRYDVPTLSGAAGEGRDLPFAGTVVPDLYRWWPADGRVERVTVGSGLQSFDPHPDGEWAVGVRTRFGVSELVRVDLRNGDVSSLGGPGFEPNLDVTWDHPRFSPDGSRVVYLRHDAGDDRGWRVRVQRLDGDRSLGQALDLPTPPGSSPTHPAWLPDGRSIVVSLGRQGFRDLWQYTLGPGGRYRLTQTQGGAEAPAPSPDGRLFFLALEDDGFDLRVLPVSPESSTGASAWMPSGEDAARLAPVVRPPARTDVEPVELSDPPASRDYGLGPREWLPLLGGSMTGEGSRVELGLRQGDPIGRLDAWILGAVTEGDLEGEGFGAALKWRRSSWDLGLRLFATREVGEGSTERHRGVQITAEQGHASRAWSWSRQVGFLEHRVRYQGSDVEAPRQIERRLVFLRGAASVRRSWGPWSLRPRLGGELQRGETDGQSWSLGSVRSALSLSHRPAGGFSWVLGLHWHRTELENLASPVDRLRLGGPTGSLIPQAALPRFAVPALPTDTLLGDRVEIQRIDLKLGGAPARFFFARHRVGEGRSLESRLDLWGLEASFNQAPLPLLRLPGFDLDLGVAQILDEPFEDEVEAWIELRWRP